MHFARLDLNVLAISLFATTTLTEACKRDNPGFEGAGTSDESRADMTGMVDSGPSSSEAETGSSGGSGDGASNTTALDSASDTSTDETRGQDTTRGLDGPDTGGDTTTSSSEGTTSSSDHGTTSAPTSDSGSTADPTGPTSTSTDGSGSESGSSSGTDTTDGTTTDDSTTDGTTTGGITCVPPASKCENGMTEYCANLEIDKKNCGTCGNLCADEILNSICIDSMCACPENLTDCGDSLGCIDTSANDEACGPTCADCTIMDKICLDSVCQSG